MEDKTKNSEEFLNSVLGNKNGFSIPKDYFENSEERLLGFLSEEKLPNKNPFSTPNLYFDSLEETIFNKVTAVEKTTKIISLKDRIYKVIPFGMAASILLFVGLTYFNNTNTEVNFDNLAQSDIETWIIDNSYDMTTQDIATLIPAENIYTSDFAFANIDDDEIEDYIISNDTTILNEY